MSAVAKTTKPRVKLNDFHKLQHMAKEQKQTMDAFSNAAARLGFGSTNLLEGTTYPITRLSFDYVRLQSLYRNDWIARKVVDCIADDMTKNWLSVVSESTPDEIELFDKSIAETGTEEQLTDAIKWARLFGGAGAVMIIEGQNNLAAPLHVDNIQPGSYKGLLVFDRWSGITPGTEVCNDIRQPLEFGLPKSYTVTTDSMSSFEVHHSRVLRFIGPKVPKWEFQVQQRWGISEIEVMYEELNKRNNTSYNIASLIFRANIFELKMKDLSLMLSGLGSNPTALKNFMAIMSAQTELMSNQGLMITNPEDGGGMSQHSYSFGGLSDMYQQFMLDVCGATGIPMSRLFGRSASGLSGTNEGDEHTYYDLIGQKQKRELTPQLRKLLPVIAMSAWGEVPDDFDWKFNPVRSMTNEQEAELVEKKSKPIIDTFNAGIIGRQTALKELRTLSEETNSFSNISDKTIDSADDTPIGGELALQDMPGMEGIRELPPGEETLDAWTEELSEEANKAFKRVSEKYKASMRGKKGAQEASGLFTEDCRNNATDLTVAMEKHSHAEVHYAAVSKDPRTTCGRCVHFLPNEQGKSGCEVVVSPIHKDGWCEEWTENAATYRTAFQGFPIFIENRTGSVRKGAGWTQRMSNDYGYIEGTLGVDGDHVDVFLGAVPSAPTAFIIRALSPKTGRYDEDKVFLGFQNGEEARNAFLANYGFEEKFFGGTVAMAVDVLREKLVENPGQSLH